MRGGKAFLKRNVQGSTSFWDSNVLSLRISGNQKAEMMSGMDQRELIPLLFRERAEKGVRERSGRHFLKCGDIGTELVEGGGLVMTGPGEPPLGNLDARL